ncbi:MAG: penicillin-binding protein 2 [Burkholderiales bacterium]
MTFGELRDTQRDLYRFQVRLGVAGAIVLIAFGTLVARFAYLQVTQHDYYTTRAEDNRISVVPIQPSRGLISDRNGVVLARNFSAYTLEINPNKTKDIEGTLNAVAEVVRLDARDRRRFKKLREESRGADSVPIRTRLSDEEVAKFAAVRYQFPNVEIRARLFRDYPLAERASHVVGYVGRINDKDIERLEAEGIVAEYRGTDHTGRIGLESSYERELHGTTGSAQIETDANGRALRTIASTPAVPGSNLVLTLDVKLQEVAERAFGGFRGALVAIEPASGEVLAFVSKPGYDPNLFIDGIDPQNWDALNNDPAKPLNNRAIYGAYPPGSTIKPFLALTALQHGKRSPDYAINDPGSFGLPGVAHRWRDWKVGGHGVVNMHKSIVISCDTYYYGLGTELGIDLIHGFMSKFGFGEKTGIDIDGERSGLMPSQEWKAKRFAAAKNPDARKWYVGDTISVAIGQGYWTATPMQLAFATAILANNGVVYKPHLVKHLQDPRSGELRAVANQPVRTIALDQRAVDFVKRAMVDVTRPGGTAAVAGLNAAYSFAGKTGTAQVIAMKQNEKYDAKKIEERFRDHALFVAFAPADNPRIALGLLVENGGSGSGTAAPIARAVLDYYLLGKVPASMPDLNPDREPD